MSDVREAPSPRLDEDRSGNPQGDFIWYELMTTDAEGAKAFYDAVVGWNVSGEGPPEYGGYRMIGRSDGKFAGGVLPLTSEMQQHGARPAWLGYIHVSDVDSAVAKIEQAGGKTYMAPNDIPNVGRIAMVTDPQGAPFYVMKPIPPANDPNAQSDVFSPTAEQRVGWNELSTSDPVAARRFYGDQFGWTSDEFMPMGDMGEYRFFQHHDVTIGAVAGAMPGQQPHWRFYIRVPSIAKAKDTVEAKGGKVAMGPMEVPGGDHILIGVDPQGAEFALVGGQ
jgi:predicted enzyme related to lactoylglutathione lyase